MSGTGEKSWRRRPVAVLIMLIIIIGLAATTQLGIKSRWSPHMNAWSSAPVPEKFLKGRTPVQLQGAIVIQAMQCRNCHALGGEGGQRGPALDDVATRLTEDQLFRQVIQGGGNMPAYGKNLSPPQATALVSFLKTLHSPGQRPAENAALVSTASVPKGP